MMRRLAAVPALLIASPVAAQDAAQDAASAASTSFEEVAGVATPIQPRAAVAWLAGAAAGYIVRQDLPDSPYATVSVTRYQNDWYLRGGLTFYKSAIQQVDAALPSTFTIASLGAGRVWGDWFADLYLSGGQQRFGMVTTPAGSRPSMVGNGTGYLAFGARGGRRLWLSDRTALLGTAFVGYAATRSLRHALVRGAPRDLLVAERAVTGSGAIRLEQTLGRTGRSQIAINVEHFRSSNSGTRLMTVPGMTPGPPGQGSDGGLLGLRTPDGWSEVGLTGTFGIARHWWLDAEVRRTSGALGGDATTASLGLRIRL
ncbi:hypothetical protein ACFOON_10025 [Novosphingobium piscinae]|uniref:Autotransporter domain-containing protein n=1 Tax=Novosphingobium piscinae TaxID=1507448 RepID=A0A7X1G047_9SPHN|nr:hypothetical protein [Novosphingobium piscinae]MBC2670193.1 hypothetical protein [Novosphingobium piscinae]